MESSESLSGWTRARRLVCRGLVIAVAAWLLVLVLIVNWTQHVSTTCVGIGGDELGVIVRPERMLIYHASGSSRSREFQYDSFLVPDESNWGLSKVNLDFWYHYEKAGLSILEVGVRGDHQMAIGLQHWLSFLLIACILTLPSPYRRLRSRLMSGKHSRPEEQAHA